MDPASSFRSFEPNLAVFYCERCCGATPLGSTGGDHRCHLVPQCASQVGAQRIGEAFADGADGVLILGCVGRACRAPLTDLAALRHLHEGTMALHRLGFDPARLRRGWITPREAPRVPALVTAFRRRLAALGPRREMGASAPAEQPMSGVTVAQV
jgi:F420-non-reducing hydrogenase iron-sulfur subunit